MINESMEKDRRDKNKNKKCAKIHLKNVLVSISYLEISRK